MTEKLRAVKQAVSEIKNDEKVLKETLVFLRDHYPSTIEDAGDDIVLKFNGLDSSVLDAILKYAVLAKFRAYMEKLEKESPEKFENVIQQIRETHPASFQDDALDISVLPLDLVNAIMSAPKTVNVTKVEKIPVKVQKVQVKKVPVKEVTVVQPTKVVQVREVPTNGPRTVQEQKQRVEFLLYALRHELAQLDEMTTGSMESLDDESCGESSFDDYYDDDDE